MIVAETLSNWGRVVSAADLVSILAATARLVVEAVPTELYLRPTKEQDSVESPTLLE
jgi:hypothetical protein